MGNKQGEMETVVQLENYDQMAITEKWWDESHNWTMTVMCYKLYRRRNWQGRRDGGVATYVKKLIDCEELSLRNSYEWIESLWVQIRDQTNSLLGSTTGCLIKGILWMKPSCFNYKYHICRLSSS